MKNKFQNLYQLCLLCSIVFGAIFIVLLFRGVVLFDSLQKVTIEIVLNLSVSCVSGLFSVVISLFSRKVSNARRLWKLSNPSKCAICVSAHQWPQALDDGGKRTRTSVSEGQIMALPHVLSSLHQAYGETFDWSRLYNAYQSDANTAFGSDDDLILIGGSVTNPLTGGIFNQIKQRVQINYNHKVLKVNTKEYMVERGGKPSDGIYEVTKDYAVIIHATLRGATANRRVVVIAGCTTLGTGAAGQFFCSQMIHTPQWQKMGSDNYVAVLACPFANKRPDMENTEVVSFINF